MGTVTVLTANSFLGKPNVDNTDFFIFRYSNNLDKTKQYMKIDHSVKFLIQKIVSRVVANAAHPIIHLFGNRSYV